MLVILEGESLLNDASALLVYRLAVIATVCGTPTAPQVADDAFHRLEWELDIAELDIDSRNVE
jgi:NhaP-type Na+/H+ or K+/H+ antiporter